MDHQIFEYGTWKTGKTEEHPRVDIKVSINDGDYAAFNMCAPTPGEFNSTGVTDSGAQVCLFPRRDLHKLNLKREDLFRVKHKIYAANRTPIAIDGAFLTVRDSETSESVEVLLLSDVNRLITKP